MDGNRCSEFNKQVSQLQMAGLTHLLHIAC